MQITRRNFIQSLVGGTVGINLTPLPWKLTDDIAIWTQNWPWVPVPPTGEFTETKSICHLCPGGCGIKVRKVDDRAVKIEGRSDYPVNPGGICPLGMGGLQLLYNASIRYTSPMKRVGPRGEGQFVDISWNEALDILVRRISDLRTQGRPESLAAVDGNPGSSTMSHVIERLLKVIGSPNYVRTPSIEDTYRTGNLLMQGTEGPMAYDLENADYILSFGCGLLEGWGSPGRVMNAWGLWHDRSAKKELKVVQIESRASNTASKADHWMATRPGTDAALAMGLAHVIIKESLYDKNFVNEYCFGFDDWSSADGRDHMGFKTLVLKKYSPSKVASITGLNPKKIVSVARDFAKAKAPIAIYGKGKDVWNGGTYEFMAVQSLNALMGNINRAGGVLVTDPLPLSPLPETVVDEIAREGLRKPRLDQAETMKHPFTKSLINNLSEAIIDNPESAVDTLLVFAANPAYTLPDGGAFRKALNNIPFIASFSPFRDETSYMADLILPDHTYLEKMDDVVWPSGLQYPMYALSKPVVDPIYDTRHSGDVIIQLAKRIGNPVKSGFPWKNFQEILKVRAKGLFDSEGGLVSFDSSVPPWQQQKMGGSPKRGYKSAGDMWKKIKSSGFWYQPAHTYKQWEKLFKTPSGRFEFFSSQIELAVGEYSKETSEKTALKNMGVGVKGDEACMPHYETYTSNVKRSGDLLLLSPYEMINLSSGWIPNPPYLYKTLFDNQLLKNDSFAEINPDTAGEQNLKDGDRVVIKSSKGKVRVRLKLSERAMPGVVYLPSGMGHTAYDEFIRGKGANPNDIIAPKKDPLSGHLVWWNTPVTLSKVV